MFDFNEEKIKDVFSLQFGNRISHLAAAGSIVNNRSNHSSDLDLLLILDERGQDDLIMCRTAVQSLRPYKIDLSLKYLDELPSNAVDFQDGPRTSLCLAYISSAHFIIGDNIFPMIFSTLPPYEFRKSIIHAVGEYLMRMESGFFTTDENDQEALQKQCFKYLTRVIIDVKLFFLPSDMEPYKLLNREEILTLGKKDVRINKYINHITQNSPAYELLNVMSNLHSYLIENSLIIKKAV